MNEIITSENYNKAVALHKKIAANAQAAQECLYEVCKGLKEMRDDKLYKELGYQNFEDYTESEVGIKRRQAYNYIKIVEGYGENVQSIAQIGTTKLALLCDLSEDERIEITENNDLESVSVRELKNQIEMLKVKADKAESLSHALDDIKSENNRLTHNAKVAQSKVESLESKIKEKEKDIISLEETIEELENRPVDVAVQESAETEELKNEIQQLTHQHELQLSDIKNEHSAEIEKIKSEYEKKLSEQPEAVTVEDTKSVFKAYLSTAIDAANRLLAFIEQHPESVYIEKTRELFKAVIEKAGEIE